MSRPPSTCLPKAMGFSNVSTIHCSTRTDTELLGVLDRRIPKSLFRGEVYGGYWAQNQEQQQPNVIGLGVPTGIPTDTNSGVFGGRLSYYPTRYWTITAQVDQTLGMSTTLSPSIPQGAPTRTTTAILQTTYGIARDWSIGVRGGYTRGEFIGVSGLNNNGWLAGASFNYEIWRNLLLTLDYQYYDRAIGCGILRFYAQLGHCRPYIQVLSEVVLMAGSKRNWTKELRGFAGVSHV